MPNTTRRSEAAPSTSPASGSAGTDPAPDAGTRDEECHAERSPERQLAAPRLAEPFVVSLELPTATVTAGLEAEALRGVADVGVVDALDDRALAVLWARALQLLLGVVARR